MSVLQAPQPNGVDDTPILQTLLDNIGRGGVLELQPSSLATPYKLSKPLFVNSYNPLITGRYGAAQTVVQCLGYFPGIVRVPPAQMNVPTDGDALILDGTQGKFVNLSADCWFLNLNNVCPWRCQFELRLDAWYEGGGESNIIASQGMLGMTQDTFTQAFAVNEREGRLAFVWKWGETESGRLVSGCQLVVGQSYLVEVSFDGTDATLSIDNAICATQSCPNAIQQSWHEDVCIGSIPYRWPDGSTAAQSVTGQIRNVVITGTGTDVAPKFGECYGPMVPIDEVYGRHWTVYRRQGAFDFNPVCLNGFTVQNGTGVYLFNAVNSRVTNVDCFQTFSGIVLNDNCFKSVLQNVHTACTRFGVAFVGSANSLCQMDNFQLQDSLVGLLISEGGGKFTNGFIYGNNVGAAVVIKGDWVTATLDAIGSGDEGTPGPGPAYGIYAAGVKGLEITGCTGAYVSYPIPPIVIDGCTGVRVAPFAAAVTPTTPCVVRRNADDETPTIENVSFVGANTCPILGGP